MSLLLWFPLSGFVYIILRVFFKISIICICFILYTLVHAVASQLHYWLDIADIVHCACPIPLLSPPSPGDAHSHDLFMNTTTHYFLIVCSCKISQILIFCLFFVKFIFLIYIKRTQGFNDEHTIIKELSEDYFVYFWWKEGYLNKVLLKHEKIVFLNFNND